MNAAQLRPLPVIAALLGAGAAIWSTWPPLVHTWRVMADYQHGGLLALFLLAWVYQRANRARYTPHASPLAALLLLGALLAWLVAYRAVSSIGQQIMTPPILWLAVWMSCGVVAARLVAAPILCLYFAIPVWEALLPALQHLTVVVSETALGWLGVPAAINGPFVTIPEGTFEIAEGCAGKRYLIVALTVAAVFAGTAGLRPRRALAFLGITAALALVINWLRVITVIYAGHLTDMQSYLVAREHLSLGWFLFALLVAIVCVIGWHLAPAPGTAREAGPPAAEAPRAASFPRSGIAATLLLLCVPFAAQLYARHALAPPGNPPALHLPELAGWRGPRAPDPVWAPHCIGASSETHAAYDGEAGAVQVFVAEYLEQRAGAKLISYDNTLTGSEWLQLRAGALDPTGRTAGSAAPAALWMVTPDGQAWIVSYVYQVDRVVTASPVLAQLAYGTLSWSGVRPSRLVAIAAPCHDSCDETQRILSMFWSRVGELLLR